MDEENRYRDDLKTIILALKKDPELLREAMETLLPSFFVEFKNLLEKLTRQIEERCVLVHWESQGRASVGSGVIVETNRVLANFHALETRVRLDVCGQRSRVGKVNQENDLLLLKVKTEQFPRLTFGTAERYDIVLSVGNPACIEKVASLGMVMKKEETYLYTTHAIIGSSGAGLWNMKGELVGVQSAAAPNGDIVGTDHLAVAINSGVVKKFLGWRK